MELSNPNPTLHGIVNVSRLTEDVELERDEDHADPIDALEVYELLRMIKDPEHPNTLEELRVVNKKDIYVAGVAAVAHEQPASGGCCGGGESPAQEGGCCSAKANDVNDSMASVTSAVSFAKRGAAVAEEGGCCGGGTCAKQSTKNNNAPTNRVAKKAAARNDKLIKIHFTPTVPHCSMTTLIGLCIRVKLMRTLPPTYKIIVKVAKGSHEQEEQVNKQLNDKERVAAALENTRLMAVITECIQDF